MMEISVGHLDLGYIEEYSDDGSEISGLRPVATIAAGLATRDALLDMVGTVQRVVMPDEVGATGFYRLTSAGAAFADEETWSWSLGIEPVPHRRTAMVETTLFGADSDATPGGVTPTPWFAIPSSAAGYDPGVSVTTHTRLGVGTSVTYMEGAGLYDARLLYQSSAEDCLDAGVTISFDGAQVVGRQDSLDASWEISNGLLKIGEGSGSSLLALTPPNGALTGWAGQTLIGVGYWDGVSAITTMAASEIVARQVIVDTPALCIVRLVRAVQSILQTIDVSLRRGSRLVEVVCSSRTPFQFGLQAAAGTWANGSTPTITSAITTECSALLVGESSTRDASIRAVYSTAAVSTRRLGIGIAGRGALDVAPNQNDDLRDQFFASLGVSERFAGVLT